MNRKKWETAAGRQQFVGNANDQQKAKKVEVPKYHQLLVFFEFSEFKLFVKIFKNKFL
jgi:hypothetical protein